MNVDRSRGRKDCVKDDISKKGESDRFLVDEDIAKVNQTQILQYRIFNSVLPYNKY